MARKVGQIIARGDRRLLSFPEACFWITSGWPTNRPESPGPIRTPTAPEKRSCVDCYHHLTRLPASRSAEKWCK